MALDCPQPRVQLASDEDAVRYGRAEGVVAMMAHDLRTRIEAELSAAPEPVVVRAAMPEYLSTTYRPDREWIAGELKERNVGEGPHAVVQKFLAMFLGTREDEWSILVRTEQRVQVSVDRFRVPDVCVTRSEDPFETIVRVPPLLCIEILSREDTVTEMMERVDDYLAMGVPTVWMVDPRRRSASMIDGGGSYRKVQELVVPGTAILLHVSMLFAQLNRLEGTAQAGT